MYGCVRSHGNCVNTTTSPRSGARHAREQLVDVQRDRRSRASGTSTTKECLKPSRYCRGSREARNDRSPTRPPTTWSSRDQSRSRSGAAQNHAPIAAATPHHQLHRSGTRSPTWRAVVGTSASATTTSPRTPATRERLARCPDPTSARSDDARPVRRASPTQHNTPTRSEQLASARSGGEPRVRVTFEADASGRRATADRPGPARGAGLARARLQGHAREGRAVPRASARACAPRSCGIASARPSSCASSASAARPSRRRRSCRRSRPRPTTTTLRTRSSIASGSSIRCSARRSSSSSRSARTTRTRSTKHLASAAYSGIVPSRPGARDLAADRASRRGVLKHARHRGRRGPAHRSATSQLAASLDADEFLAEDRPEPEPVIPTARRRRRRGARRAEVAPVAETSIPVAAAAPAGSPLPAPLRHLSAEGVAPRAAAIARCRCRASRRASPTRSSPRREASSPRGGATRTSRRRRISPPTSGSTPRRGSRTPTRSLYRIAVAAALAFRLDRDRDGVIAAYTALDKAGVLADLYQGTVPENLPGAGRRARAHARVARGAPLRRGPRARRAARRSRLGRRSVRLARRRARPRPVPHRAVLDHGHARAGSA